MEDDEDDGIPPRVREEERPDDRRDDDAGADAGCGCSGGGCRVRISLARAGGAEVASSAIARLPLLRSRTDSCSRTGTGSTSGSAREGAETVALMSCSRRRRSTMSETRPISGELDEMRTWLSASAEGTDGSGTLAVVASPPARPVTALDDGGARGCPVVEVVFTEL